METTSLNDLVHQQLAAARNSSSRRSAHTVYGGHDQVLRHTVLALTAGFSLDEHDNPGEATVQVLRGRVRLAAGDAGCEGQPGELLIVPQERHSLEAIEDSVVLLTVAKSGGGYPASARRDS